MVLAYRHDKGRFYPELICDSCGKPIEDWGLGIVKFEYSKSKKFLPVHIYHKGACDHDEELSEELSTYLPWLLTIIGESTVLQKAGRICLL